MPEAAQVGLTVSHEKGSVQETHAVKARRPVSARPSSRAPLPPQTSRPASARPACTGRPVSAGTGAARNDMQTELDCRSVAWDGRTFRLRNSGLAVTSIGASAGADDGERGRVAGAGCGDGKVEARGEQGRHRSEGDLRQHVAEHLRLNLDLADFLNPTPRDRIPKRPSTARPAASSVGV